jgi:hypothetical protein
MISGISLSYRHHPYASRARAQQLHHMPVRMSGKMSVASRPHRAAAPLAMDVSPDPVRAATGEGLNLVAAWSVARAWLP